MMANLPRQISGRTIAYVANKLKFNLTGEYSDTGDKTKSRNVTQVAEIQLNPSYI